MKKYVIDYDNKIKTYLLIYIATATVSSILSIVLGIVNINDVMPLSGFARISFLGIPYAIMMLVGLIFAAIILYTFYMSVSFRCVFNEDHMRYGTLGLRKLFYEDIEAIEFDRHIVIKWLGKKSKIRVLNFEENIDKYQELMADLKEHSGQGFDVDEAMAKLSYINKFEFAEEGKSLRLNGWLFVVFVSSIIFTALMGLYVILTLIVSVLTIHWAGLLVFLLVGGIFALSLILTIMIGKRSNKAPGFIRIVMMVCIALVAVAVIVSLVVSQFTSSFMKSSMMEMTYMTPSYVLLLAGFIAYTLMIFRALEISKRVKYTFVYDEGEKVQNYDKSVDPGFKLFAWEPASIFGVLSWIVMPITYILLYIIIIVVIFFGAAAMY